ncbi:MAG TPA: permease-like cell division protein FtsX [Vicinamibacterales bacterium]|nr:permease-like cell division protein FtsX [Vicinamibacterales bacterium]
MGSLKYFLTEAVASLIRGWRAALLAVLTIAAGLFILGFFLIVNANLQRVVGRWSEGAELSVYLEDDVTREELGALEQLVDRSGLAAERRYVSKDEAGRRFREDFPDLAAAADGLGSSPFPASIEVRLTAGARDAGGAVDAFAANLGRAPGVADLRYDRRWLGRLNAAMRFARGIGLLVIAMLAIAAALTVANVVRLAAYARRDEIEIMQLVGAPFAYIRGPFVAEGILQGGAGALVALALLWAVFVAGRARFGQLAADGLGLGTLTFLPVELWVLLIVGGMALGSVGGLVVARSVR